MSQIEICQIDIRGDIALSYVGPSLDAGPLPALFYFSLSGLESLSLDPFNQPVAYLTRHPMRIFSIDLPGHGKGLDPLKAMTVWAEELKRGIDIVGLCVDQIHFAVEKLSELEVLIPGRIGVAGLSRGGFIACHTAAKIAQLQTVLLFAPLTRLGYIKEFQDFPYADRDLIHLVPALCKHKIRTYIGNRDSRVGTDRCFEFTQALAENAYQQRIRSPQIELIISPSIGHQGHGTPKEIFEQGAEWIWGQLNRPLA